MKNERMFKLDLMTAEWAFILIFGLFHLLVPFIAPPNFLAAIIPIYILFFELHIVDFVIPGSIALAVLSVIFVYTKNRYVMAALIFEYLGGAFFHALYLIGILPGPILLIPYNLFLASAFGLFIDVFTTVVIYDFYRRNYSKSKTH